MIIKNYSSITSHKKEKKEVDNIKKILKNAFLENGWWFIDHNDKYLINTLRLIRVLRKKYTVFPTLENIDDEILLKPFNLTPFLELKIVMIGNFPTSYENGLCFGMSYKENRPIPKKLLNIQKEARKAHCGNFNFKIDYTLEDWADQGILMINSILTSSPDVNRFDLHNVIWQPFIKKLIKGINENSLNTIFVFWGDENDYLKKYINSNHTILSYPMSPSHAIYMKEKWEPGHLKEINLLLMERRRRLITWGTDKRYPFR